MRRLSIILLVAGIGFALHGASFAVATPLDNLVYGIHQCTTDNPCNLLNPPHGSAPPPGAFDGFNQQAFMSFYGRNFGVPYTINIRGTNDSGYIYGSVAGVQFANIQFVFRGGAVLCCHLDEPYMIDDLNDQGIFSGNNPYVLVPCVQPGCTGAIGAFLAEGFDEGDYLAPQFLPIVADSYLPLWNTLVANGGYGASFVAIDNNDNILLSVPSGLYELSPIPEPGSILLMFTSLLCLAGIGAGKRLPRIRFKGGKAC